MNVVSQSVGFIQLAKRPASGRSLRTAGGETFSQVSKLFLRYISCTRDPDSGQLLQENLECPGDLVFANEWGKFILGITLPSPTRYGIPGEPGTGECVDYDRATACKTFNQPTTPCLYSCPRCWLNLQLIFFAILLQLKLICGLDSMLNFEV